MGAYSWAWDAVTISRKSTGTASARLSMAGPARLDINACLAMRRAAAGHTRLYAVIYFRIYESSISCLFLMVFRRPSRVRG